MEHSSGSPVGQSMYPLESVASVTTAATAQLTTLQSSGWEPRAGYGDSMDEPTEQPALHTEVSGVNTLSATERERCVQVTPCANGRSALLQKRIHISDHDPN